MFRCLCAIGISIAAFAGCTGEPTKGDIMRQYASTSQEKVDLKYQLAKDWNRGSTLVKSGEKRVEEGEKQIASAKKDLEKGKEAVARGKKEIAKGTKLMQESERRFRENFPDLQIQY
jgi:hypothetical protein